MNDNKRFNLRRSLDELLIEYSPGLFYETVEIMLKEKQENIEKSEFRAICRRYGFLPEDYGQTFYDQGKRFKITGLNPRAKKYPVIAKCLNNGKEYKFTVMTVKDFLKKVS